MRASRKVSGHCSGGASFGEKGEGSEAKNPVFGEAAGRWEKREMRSGKGLWKGRGGDMRDVAAVLVLIW
jgi:hypothetical protein